MKIQKKTMIGSILFIFVAGLIYLGKNYNGSMDEKVTVLVSASPIRETSTTKELEKKEEPTKERICCYVCGAVKSPGVYDFTKGERLCDIIEKAGGFGREAAREQLNLARCVTDGEQIYVPTKKEVVANGLDVGVASEKEEESKQVNLNSADIDELMELPGIGEMKAKTILSYREEHGRFKTIEELKDVEGIKDGVYNKVKDLIVVQ